MKTPETWIRVGPIDFDHDPRMVIVWVHLGEERTLLIRSDGSLQTTLRWSHFSFKNRASPPRGIVRIS